MFYSTNAVYCILLALYALLLVFYAARYKEPTVKRWSLLTKPDPDVDRRSLACRDHDECPRHYVCVQGQCRPQLLRGETCSEETGSWQLTTLFQKQYALCVCTYPTLVTQKFRGGNCNVPVACQPHGTYSFDERRCVCPKGYKADGLTCLKMTVLEMDAEYACEQGEIERDQLVEPLGFHPDYVDGHRDKKCFRTPCAFDAYTGKPLIHTRYEEGVGCVCDPTLGQFGVRIEKGSLNPLFQYLRGEGYNACSSLFETPLEKPIPVDMYSYFYLFHPQPVVFLRYTIDDPSKLATPFRRHHHQKASVSGVVFAAHLQQQRANTLHIAQEFPYDYMQYFFRTRMWATAKRLQKYRIPLPSNPSQQKLVLEKQTHAVEWCRYMMRPRHMSKVLRNLYLRRVYDYNLLYNFPMCYIAKDDASSLNHYRGRYILNPLQLLYKTDNVEQPRFNGVHVGFDGVQWNVDFAPPYDIQTYLTAASHADHGIPDISQFVMNANQLHSYYHDVRFRSTMDVEKEYKAEIQRKKNEPVFFP